MSTNTFDVLYQSLNFSLPKTILKAFQAKMSSIVDNRAKNNNNAANANLPSLMDPRKNDPEYMSVLGQFGNVEQVPRTHHWTRKQAGTTTKNVSGGYTSTMTSTPMDVVIKTTLPSLSTKRKSDELVMVHATQSSQASSKDMIDNNINSPKRVCLPLSLPYEPSVTINATTTKVSSSFDSQSQQPSEQIVFQSGQKQTPLSESQASQSSTTSGGRRKRQVKVIDDDNDDNAAHAVAAASMSQVSNSQAAAMVVEDPSRARLTMHLNALINTTTATAITTPAEVVVIENDEVDNDNDNNNKYAISQASSIQSDNTQRFVDDSQPQQLAAGTANDKNENINDSSPMQVSNSLEDSNVLATERDAADVIGAMYALCEPPAVCGEKSKEFVTLAVGGDKTSEVHNNEMQEIAKLREQLAFAKQEAAELRLQMVTDQKHFGNAIQKKNAELNLLESELHRDSRDRVQKLQTIQQSQRQQHVQHQYASSSSTLASTTSTTTSSPVANVDSPPKQTSSWLGSLQKPNHVITTTATATSQSSTSSAPVPSLNKSSSQGVFKPLPLQQQPLPECSLTEVPTRIMKQVGTAVNECNLWTNLDVSHVIALETTELIRRNGGVGLNKLPLTSYEQYCIGATQRYRQAIANLSKRLLLYSKELDAHIDNPSSQLSTAAKATLNQTSK